MLITRFGKIVMCLVLAVFCLLVAFDNLTDYETNYLFVRHVLSMDTTFAGNGLMYRSISDPLLWRVAYGLIIAAEAVTGLLFLAGAVRMWQARKLPAPTSIAPRPTPSPALWLAFLVWFFGFMVIAGEWFAMWAIADLERPAGSIPVLHGGARRADLAQPAGSRPAGRCGRAPASAHAPANGQREPSS